MTPPLGTKASAAAFTKAVQAKYTALASHLPPPVAPAVTESLLQECVFEQIRELINPKQILATAVIMSEGTSSGADTSLPVSGIIHDPSKGSLPLTSGRFAIVNTRTCAGMINIRSRVRNLPKFQNQLWKTRKQLPGISAPSVMGVVIRDLDAVRKSEISKAGHRFNAYELTRPKWCPIFILFSQSAGTLEPHTPAIESLFANIHLEILRPS